MVGYDLQTMSSWVRLIIGLILSLGILKMGKPGTVPDTSSVNAPSPSLTIVEVANPVGLRLRPPKSVVENEPLEMEVTELKVEQPVESVSTTTTTAAPSAAVVVIDSAGSASTIPDLDEDDDEDALFERIAAAAAMTNNTTARI